MKGRWTKDKIRNKWCIKNNSKLDSKLFTVFAVGVTSAYKDTGRAYFHFKSVFLLLPRQNQNSPGSLQLVALLEHLGFWTHWIIVISLSHTHTAVHERDLFRYLHFYAWEYFSSGNRNSVNSVKSQRCCVLKCISLSSHLHPSITALCISLVVPTVPPSFCPLLWLFYHKISFF